MDNTISRSDMDKEERLEDDAFEDQSPKRPNSGSTGTSTCTRPPSGETVLKKQAESVTIGSRPGTTKARPIPENPIPENETMPKDPDKDNPGVYVSAT